MSGNLIGKHVVIESGIARIEDRVRCCDGLVIYRVRDWRGKLIPKVRDDMRVLRDQGAALAHWHYATDRS